MSDWKTCAHRFVPWFGPVLKCQRCGAKTMVSMDPKESKHISPPNEFNFPPPKGRVL